MGARRKGRVLAFQTLYAYELSSRDDGVIEFPWIDDRARFHQDSLDFARLIAAGTLEKLEEIDTQIRAQLEHWDFSRLNKVDQAILRISAYSLLHQPEIPASVTIDEAVDISKEFGTDESYRFINGVLDGIRKSMEP